MQTISTTPLLSLDEILALSLQAGLLMHQSGAGTHRTSMAMQRIAKALGAARVDIMISSTNIGATVERANELGNETLTAFRKAPHMGANFSSLTAVRHWLHQLEHGEIDAKIAKRQLDEIAGRATHYPRWLITILVGISCGAFAALFGGDIPAIIFTTIGAACGMAVRFFMVLRHFKPSIFATASSFVALLITGLLAHQASSTPDAALAASVLFLIPGVPLINGAADLLNGNYLNGIVRFTMSAVIIFGIAVGVSIALRILG
ncbi:threonine/serine exporter family protein [Chitinibacter bivalviorum]|uniref:Threonine/serine exporter family protein n=1 Tax=Chitinibacter bivalviorum TaxID=2739434 RepID=A0A7H9BK49_9NEIS|nr:threonine/serine exporter family protein [Chitinibacter bivalviorum]QLG88943.1 threonine/serine exporter family protein [Chitinibacter bivalviorum]